MTESGEDTGRRQVKVERIVDEYDLHGMEAELADRWTAEDGERRSLRELARFFNEQVLAAALGEAGMETLDGDVSNIYRLLTDEDVSAGQRTETRSRLDQEGVDLSEVESDFVSHQAIQTFLTDRQTVSLPVESDETRLEKSRETLRKLHGRVGSVAINDIERLVESGALEVGDVSVLLSLDVVATSAVSGTISRSYWTRVAVVVRTATPECQFTVLALVERLPKSMTRREGVGRRCTSASLACPVVSNRTVF